MKALAPNTLLQNRYLVVQLIGKGGMGEVYLAVDQRLGSAVALKRTFFSDDEMLGNAFEREAKTLARLRHAVLPKVSDHFTESGTQYLAMEHISGDDLAKRLEITNKPFPLSWVLFWTDQLLDALSYLHSYDPPIIHRDIKPQNLKLTGENHIVLLDFGLAKNSLENTRVNSTTGGSSIVGYTPHYAPMEQIRGTGTNSRSDLYSLAATVYQLLTNTVPPDALTRADNVLNGLPDPIKPLYEINAEIPRLISAVVLKAMSLGMDQRYPDAREMQKDLREAYAGVQSAMAAQTVAFNTSDAQQQKSQALPESQQKTGDFTPAAGRQPAAHTENIPVQTDNSAAQNHNLHDDFNAAMKDEGKSFGIKTEVLPAEKMPKAENFSVPSIPKNEFFADEKEDNFSFSAPEKEFDPNATFPLINFDRKNIPTDEVYDSLSETEENYAPSEIFAAGETAASGQEKFPPVSASMPAEPKKKSGGKGLLAAGVLGGLAIVAIGAAAIGWYVFKSSAITTTTPTPTPVVESTATPSATPTVEPTVEAITNTGNSNSEAVISDTTTADNTNDKKTDVTTNDVKTPNDKPVQTTPARATPTPQPRVVINTPPRPTPPPVKTPSPTQKTPGKGGRADILQ